MKYGYTHHYRKRFDDRCIGCRMPASDPPRPNNPFSHLFLCGYAHVTNLHTHTTYTHTRLLKIHTHTTGAVDTSYVGHSHLWHSADNMTRKPKAVVFCVGSTRSLLNRPITRASSLPIYLVRIHACIYTNNKKRIHSSFTYAFSCMHPVRQQSYNRTHNIE